MHAEMNTEGTFTYPNLLAGEFPRVETKVTVLSGESLVAGTVLGRVTASGKMVAVDDSLGDGAENPYAILAEDVDASAADTEGMAYLSGHFNEDALTFGDDDTADDHRDALRTLGIFLTKNVGA